MQIIDNIIHVFSKDNEAITTASPGEILIFKTQDCFGGQITREDQLIHEIDFSLANPTAGPVYIEGAEIGDTIAVDILDICVANEGFACTIEGIGPMSQSCDVRTRLLKIMEGSTTFNGITWNIEPMIGVIGTAPSIGAIPNGYPGDHGGNMDSRIIKKGARIYLPVRTEGALLQIGDLHASMGDGELSGAGLEIAGEVTVKVDLIKNFELNWPVTETEDFFYVNTSAMEYEDALVSATEEMYRLMKPIYNWDKADTSIYFSLRGNIEVNQSARPVLDEESAMGMTLRFGIPKVAGQKHLISK